MSLWRPAMSERDELVVRLRGLYRESWPSVRDAADQIERDGREIERLRATLSAITATDCYSRDECTAMARAALNGEGET